MNDFNKEMNDIANAFISLKEQISKQDKLDKLDELSVNNGFNSALIFLLDNNITSGMKTSKINKKLNNVNKLLNIKYNSLSSLLTFLKINNTGNDQEIFIVQNFLKRIENENSRKVIEEIICKTYKCGVTDKTAYGHIPGLERNWLERKGYSLIDIKTGEIDIKPIKDKNIIVSLKLDGYRCKIYKNKDIIKIYSASGKEIEGMNQIIEEVKNLKDGLYDGECQATGDFENSTARFNATSKIIAKIGEKKDLEIVVFDYLTIEESNKFFNFEKINKAKYLRMSAAKENIPKDLNYIKFIPTFIFNKKADKKTLEKIITKYEEVVNNGEEGLIVDIADSSYERKKGKTMFKLKPELTGDFKVIELTEGTGKQKGMLGAFIIEYKNNTVNVGSGITDSIRQEVWSNKEQYLDKLIEVKYFGETQDEKTGLLSLRLPRFKRFRHDKNDISYS